MKMKSFLQASLLILAVAILVTACNNQSKTPKSETTNTEAAAPDFIISLAQWSLNGTFFGGPISDWGAFGQQLREDPDAVIKGRDPMEFPAMAAELDIHCIELVNTFYFGKVDDMEYWKAFKQECEANDVTVGLIMCDQLGDLGDRDPEVRKANVENHYPWVDIAAYLGCHSLRVNAGGQGTAEEVAANAAEGLKMLGEYGASKGINIIVENHGGYSSDGKWLAGVMEAVNMENVGTLPDFGNFCIRRGPDGCEEQYDTYQGMADLMPWAKGVSAKSHEFDEEGNETTKDFLRIMQIVKDSGFKGYVGIEYEGSELSEVEGIMATKALLEKVIAEL
jgi:sugar phosphate isomerase/epimerase